MQPDHLARLWAFVREDTPPNFLEQWLLANPELERELGSDLYQMLTKYRFGRRWELDDMRDILRARLDPPICECDLVPDLAAIATQWSKFEDRFMASMITVAYHQKGKPWLEILKCRCCHTHWLHAHEDTVYMDSFVARIDADVTAKARAGSWPERFQTYEEVLTTGHALSMPIERDDPFVPSLYRTARLLREERPEISLEEVASLLAVSRCDAAILLGGDRRFRGVVHLSDYRKTGPAASPA
jgi:hypothetical protein